MTALNSPGITQAINRQLRELNTETHAVTTALNQAQASLTHAMKLVQLTYHQKRKAILGAGALASAPPHGNGNGHTQDTDDL